MPKGFEKVSNAIYISIMMIAVNHEMIQFYIFIL